MPCAKHVIEVAKERMTKKPSRKPKPAWCSKHQLHHGKKYASCMKPKHRHSYDRCYMDHVNCKDDKRLTVCKCGKRKP